MNSKIDCLLKETKEQEDEKNIEDLLQEKNDKIDEISKKISIYKTYILEIFKNNKNILKDAPQELKKDREFVIKFVKISGLSLEFFPEFQNDKAVVIEAVQDFGTALDFASKELKDDEDVVRKAIKKNAEALCYASDRLKDDIRIVQEAIEKNLSCLKHASSRLKKELSNKQFIMKNRTA